jgi:hypothetical protein
MAVGQTDVGNERGLIPSGSIASVMHGSRSQARRVASSLGKWSTVAGADEFEWGEEGGEEGGRDAGTW